MDRKRIVAAIALPLFTIAMVGCQSAPISSASSTSQPIAVASANHLTHSAAQSFTAAKGNFTTMIPAGWKQTDKGGDYVLAMVPAADTSADGLTTVTSETGNSEYNGIVAVQYPTLPPHIPGFLPLGGIADGYVNDLKKRYPDQAVEQREDAKLDSANARRVVSSFQKDGKPFREVALLAVHADHVFVISATSLATNFAQSQKAMDAITSAWKWTT